MAGGLQDHATWHCSWVSNFVRYPLTPLHLSVRKAMRCSFYSYTYRSRN